MAILKALAKKFKEPNLWFGICLSVLCLAIIVLTIFSLALDLFSSITLYILYIISALSLAYFIYLIVYLIPRIKLKVVEFCITHEYLSNILENYGIRTMMFSFISLLINIAYAVYQGVSAFVYSSIWYGTLCVYYLVLCLIRGTNINNSRKYRFSDETTKKQIDLKKYRNSGIGMLILTVAFLGMIVLIFCTNSTFASSGLMVYVTSAYTFYKLVLAIINIIKGSKQEDLYVQATRNLNFSGALVSLFSLQVVLFNEFSGSESNSIFNVITASVIVVVIICMAIKMIVKSEKSLKQLKSNNVK